MDPSVLKCCMVAIFFVAVILVSNLKSTKSPRLELRKRALELDPKSERKLYVRLVSRMGNHHFQIATLIALAKETGRTPVITSGTGYDIFMLYPDMTIPVLDTVTVEVQKTFPENRNVSFDRHLEDDIMLHPADVKICCFFESWRYFLPRHEQEIRKEFAVSRELKYDVNEHLWSLVMSLGKEIENAAHKSDVIYVGIHVRRGDKVKSSYGFQAAPLSYFKNSIQYFRNKFVGRKLVFVIASDDRKWVVGNIKGSDIVYSQLQGATEDFVLLTICNHTITSVGTFSWWAGYLAGGVVLYYKHPTLPGSLKHSRFQPQDYYLPDWIPYE